MQWTEHQFMAQTEGLEKRYKDENKWFYQDRDTPWDAECQHAWILYKRANDNTLGTLLLGDAKIRSTVDLLQNFGLTSGGGLSEKKDLATAKAAQDWRKGVTPSGQSAVDVVGPGSILNDQRWTPFLNDAFILGGVHGGQDFHWAEVEFQSSSQLDAARAMRDRPYLWETWRKYLLKGRNFWAGGFVRVFARELAGLKTFNYMPIFSTIEIMFKPSASDGPTFKDYLDALSKIGFQDGAASATAINAMLGEFLFGDDDALKGLSLGKN
jgi:hypothetical protein